MADLESNGSHSDCCRILYWFFLILLIMVPLPLGSNRPWAWGGLEVWIFLLVGFWLIRRGMVGDSSGAVLSHYRWPIFLLFLWSLYPLWQILPLSESVLSLLSPSTLAIRRLAGLQDLSGSISLDRHVTLQAWLKGMAYLGGFLLTLVWVNSHQRMMQLMLVLLGSGIFQAVYGLLMVRSDPYGTVSGTFVNRNHLAGLLELTIPVGIGLMISWIAPQQNVPQKIRERVLDWLQAASGRKGILSVVMVIMCLALFMTQSRSGNVSLFLSLLVVTGFAGLRRGGSSARREMRFLAPLFIISLLVGAWFGLGHLTGRLLKTDLFHEDRWEASINSLSLLNDFQLFGSGSGTFAFIYPMYRKGELSEVLRDHAHNDHVELLVEQGMVGYGVLFVALIFCWFFILNGYLRRRDLFFRGVLFASLSATLSLALHGLFDFNFQIPANALYFMVLLAIGMRAAVLPART